MEKTLFEKLEERYTETTDRCISGYMKRIKDSGEITVFNSDFTEKKCYSDVQCEFDSERQLFYTYYAGKKMYLNRNYKTQEQVMAYVSGIMQEQDVTSPHCYFSDVYYIQDGDVVIDAGVAEGNFALSVIDHVSKIYLVECDDAWIEALNYTFEQYKDKVVIIKKFLSDRNDDNNITIDKIAENQIINAIKMDIEGAEISAVIGAEKTIRANPDIRIAACSYHKHNDEIILRSVMEKYGLKTKTSDGYMAFIWDNDFFENPEFRRGLVWSVPQSTSNKSRMALNIDFPQENEIYVYIPDFRECTCRYIEDIRNICEKLNNRTDTSLIIFLNEKSNNNELLFWFIMKELNKYCEYNIDVQIVDGNQMPLEHIIKKCGNLIKCNF